MHVDRELLEARIARELWDRVLPLVHPQRRPLEVRAGPSLDDLVSITPGDPWGPPWATTWFRLRGDVPPDWAGRRVEAVIDLGFDPDAAGFQCEGLVVDAAGSPVQGIHPRRTNLRLDPVPGPVTIDLEAASNPWFVQFQPSPLGHPDTAGDQPQYRLGDAALVIVDDEAEALAHDVDVLDGLMRSLPLDDPRRARLLQTITRALDAVPDVLLARRVLRPALDLPARASAHRVVAIGHAHIDTAWLWPMRESIRKCTRTFASAVGLMDDDPTYRFACSQAQQYAWIEERHPELFERIRTTVAAGQWVPVGGQWVEPDMNLPSGESLVRQIVHGQRWFEERFGVRCTEAWIPDVFGYPAGLPQVFAAGGMRRFVTQKLSWNQQNRFPHHTFWWEGLDGTRILAHFPPVDTYNAEIEPIELAHAVTNFSEHGWSDWSLLPFGHGDGGGGPTREMLARAHRLADVDGAPRVELDTPAAFFEHVEREAAAGAPVPVWRGELYFEMHRGTLTSQIRTKLGNRTSEHLLREVELWAATTGAPVDTTDWWRRVLTQQFHDVLPGSSIRWVHDDAEAEHAALIHELTARRDALVDELATGQPCAVNSSTHDAHGVVITPVELDDDGPLQRLADGTFAAMVDAPALAVTPVSRGATEDRVVVTDRSMASQHLAIRWDDDGQLTSVIDVRRRRELLVDGLPGAALELAPDRPVHYDAWDLEAWTTRLGRPLVAANATVTDIEVLDRGPLVGRVRAVKRFGPSRAIITMTMRAGSPRLDLHVAVDWHHDEHLLSMVFPLDVRADTAACDVQFGITHRPTHRSSPWDAAKFEVCAHRFVDLSEPDFGIAVLNDGRWGHGLQDGRVRVSLLRAARYPDPTADTGHHEVTLALLPHGPGLSEVCVEADRLNRPVRIATGSADETTPPVVELTGEGVEIDAIKHADDGSGDLIVRLHEHVGARRAISLAAAFRIRRAHRCDLLEAPEDPLEVGDGIAVLTLRPFELVTLRLGRE